MIWPLLFLPFQKVGTSDLTREAKLVAAELRDVGRQGKNFAWFCQKNAKLMLLPCVSSNLCSSSEVFTV